LTRSGIDPIRHWPDPALARSGEIPRAGKGEIAAGEVASETPIGEDPVPLEKPAAVWSGRYVQCPPDDQALVTGGGEMRRRMTVSGLSSASSAGLPHQGASPEGTRASLVPIPANSAGRSLAHRGDNRDRSRLRPG
jgi:hypothetical protein